MNQLHGLAIFVMMPSGFVGRGTWTRLDGPPSGGPCKPGRFRLDAHRDAAEGCVFTGHWSYCDDPPDATAGWWWRGRKLDAE